MGERSDFYLPMEYGDGWASHNHGLPFARPVDLQAAAGQINLYVVIQQSAQPARDHCTASTSAAG